MTNAIAPQTFFEPFFLRVWKFPDEPVSYSATTNKDWIILNNESGAIEAGSSAVIVVVINPSGLANGNYNGTITIDIGGQKYTIPVTITVNNNNPNAKNIHVPISGTGYSL